jgi:FtsP/CotA-like multicopper oxidase with cupredoxin domain
MRPGGAPDYMTGCVGNYANSPLPTVTGTVAPVIISATGVWSGPAVTGTVTGGIRKFVDPLPSIPAAVPDQYSYPGSDYYEISLIQTSQKIHSDLPPTLLRMYVQTNNGRDSNGGNVVSPPAAQYLGPFIIAQKGRPVRVKFTNRLPAGAGGNLFIPVDTTIMGAGMGPDGTAYSQNRGGIHLHGGNTPWISDGTPHQWTVPASEMTSLSKGISTQDVPDMPATGAGEMTFYYTNQQSARLMFYHDHTYGITRLNVYAGVAAGYLLQDQVEATLVNGGTITPPFGAPVRVAAGTIPAAQIPLIIQDKTFIPPADQLAAQDPTWNWGPRDASGNFFVGNLWFPHVYMTNQNPSDDSGVNAMGRWDWGPWFWPPMDPSTLVPQAAESACPTAANPGQMCPGTPQPSLVPESYMDTAVVNGAAYPVLSVNPQAYRLRILNASNDRILNLTLYQATDATGALCNTTGLPTGTSTASCTEVRHIAAPDGIASQGPIPDPLTKGPQMIQIGNEAGFIPNPVVLDNQPIVYNYNRRDIVVLNVLKKNLWLGPAERGDVIVDFSAYAGKTLILYNDSGAPVPAFDTRNDYYTGDPDQTAQGGAPMTIPGYGPNTRTIMQIQVAPSGAGTAFNLAALTTALPAAFAASQPAPIIQEAAYGAAYATTYPNSYARISDTSVFTGSVTGISVNAPGTGYTAPPTVVIGAPSAGGSQATATAIITGGAVTGFTPTNPGSGYYSTPVIALTNAVGDTTGSGASGYAVGLPILRKTIQELFELNYGRMNATLGTELPFTNFMTQTTVPLGYVDPPTESFVDGQPQIWKITHNGVDTHAIHFHLFNVQVINRVGWDGAVRPPDANEIGWKETVKMSPLEDVIVAFLPMKQTLPFSLPDSVRPEDVTANVGASIRVQDLVGSATPQYIPNPLLNYGQEYVWHCHLLGHEENDMMRPMIFQVAPDAPSNLDAVRVGGTSGTTANITFVNNSAAVIQSNALAGSTGFTLQRATDNLFTAPTSTDIPATARTTVGSTVTFTDSSVLSGTMYYRVQAFTPNGTSAWSGVAQIVGSGIAAPGAIWLSPVNVAFGNQAVGTTSSSQTVTLTNSSTTSALSLASISVTGTNASDFAQTNSCPSLAAGASCQIQLTFTPSSAIAEFAALTVIGSASNSPQSVPLTGTGTAVGAGLSAPYTVTPAATGVTITQGGTAVYSLSVAPLNGFNHSITFTCSGPTGSSCLISPNPVTMDGTTVSTVKVYIDTTGGNGATANFRFGARSIFLALLPFSMMGMLLINKRRGFWLVLLLVGLCLVLGLAGCGASSGSSGTSAGLAPGTYHVVVTAASSGTATQTIPLSLVVNK